MQKIKSEKVDKALSSIPPQKKITGESSFNAESIEFKGKGFHTDRD